VDRREKGRLKTCRSALLSRSDGEKLVFGRDVSDLFAQEDPEDVLARLRVDEYESDATSQLLHLNYRADGLPIVIDRIGDQDRVAGYVAEYLEDRFADRQGVKETVVRERLDGCVELFSFCMKQRHVDGMGTPLVYAVAAWLGKQGDGLLRADDVGWMTLDGGEWFVICGD
jgi:hypothetical protein